ncbi:MAG: hypothetical protein C4532_16185 [Candidatus Abyssobacteria bacterium SURF_17]|uniref:Uncharacterized protein n=1 Tax=Candidatus Abyssobacteria bacterium SURF_17 TaxID=2093361 RepID=A0A419ES15_9BACT|nr:MAG: hypothetical protein C4532_16185 [Candidatus Abyssubacteria bacterium SURF_17]
MRATNEHNNPKRIFREQDDRVAPSKEKPDGAEKLMSIRRSELTSIVPDDINWGNIYYGKQHGLHGAKRHIVSGNKNTD